MNSNTSFLAGSFRLASPDGRVVDSNELAGRPYALFFGFTHCPDICPATLADLSSAFARAAKTAPVPTLYFVTIDPERDTPQVLAQYMTSFDPHIVALTGARPAVDEAIRGFGIVARRAELPDGNYTYGHTALIFLVDGDGLIVGRMGVDTSPAEMAEKLAALAAGTVGRPKAR